MADRLGRTGFNGLGVVSLGRFDPVNLALLPNEDRRLLVEGFNRNIEKGLVAICR